jgi:hypothetical protein
VKERSEHVHEAAKDFFLHVLRPPCFEVIIFPGSMEVFLGTLRSVPGSIFFPVLVFMFPETDFTLLGKLTHNPESFKPLPGSNCFYAGATIFVWSNKLQFGRKPETVRIRLVLG